MSSSFNSGDFGEVRRLIVVLGDQLNQDLAALSECDRERDAVLMLEVEHEATYIPQHKTRLVLFFSAMRHFAQGLRDAGYRVVYSNLDDRLNRGDFRSELGRWINKLHPQDVAVTKPGDYRVEEELRRATQDADKKLLVQSNNLFLDTQEQFEEFAQLRKSLLLEDYYRRMRRRFGLLIEDGEPVGGRWNYDKDNRQTLTPGDAARIKAPRSFQTDDITQAVIGLVERRFPDAPGSCKHFDYPVTRQQAKDALYDFISHRLAHFGAYQDAMLSGRPYLYHSRLSAALNLHLITPLEAIDAALRAWRRDAAPLNSVEGFVRQILGWREFVRGIYWWRMPDYVDSNALGAKAPMPAFMWSGETDMRCVRESMTQLIDHAYAHHIQRLMVLGLFSLLLGVRPYDVHRWHISMYADAIDWVSMPNVLGMSQYADGGVVGTKPYCASGNYIHKMSDYCKGCRFDPKQARGDKACPFTTLYWDFLARHRRRWAGNRRMGFQIKNLDRKRKDEVKAIRGAADALRDKLTETEYL